MNKEYYTGNNNYGSDLEHKAFLQGTNADSKHHYSTSDPPSSSSVYHADAKGFTGNMNDDKYHSDSKDAVGKLLNGDAPKAILSLSGVILECNDAFSTICQKTSRFLINTNITSLAKFDTPAALLEAAYKLDGLGESHSGVDIWKAKLATDAEETISDGAPLSATTEPTLGNGEGYMIVVTRLRNNSISNGGNGSGNKGQSLLEATLKPLSGFNEDGSTNTSNTSAKHGHHRIHSMSQELSGGFGSSRDSFVSIYGNSPLLPVTTPTNMQGSNHTSPTGPHHQGIPTSSSASFSFPTRHSSMDASRLAGHYSGCPSPVPGMTSTDIASTASSVAANVSVLAEPKNLKVLIVEDSPTSLKLMSRMISRLGHHVSTATNGKDALELLKQESYDIVLMDINMPLMNGLQASHEFRKLEQQNRASGKPYQKIIAMSGDISNTLFTEVTNAGFDAFIPKPLTEERFHEVLHMPSNGCK